MTLFALPKTYSEKSLSSNKSLDIYSVGARILFTRLRRSQMSGHGSGLVCFNPRIRSRSSLLESAPQSDGNRPIVLVIFGLPGAPTVAVVLPISANGFRFTVT
jgi:hypothetical protein